MLNLRTIGLWGTFLWGGLFFLSCSDDDNLQEPCDPNAPLAKVAHYEYDFDLESQQARSRLTLTFEEAGCCLEVENKSELTTSPWIETEEDFETEQNGDVHSFCFANMQAPDSTFFLNSEQFIKEETIDNSQVGFSKTSVTPSHELNYMLSWVNGCSQFGPCDPSPDAFATYDFNVTHPEDTQVLCPGNITQEQTQTRCEFLYEGGPTYSSFGIISYSNWEKTPLSPWAGIDVSVYDNRSNTKMAIFDVEYHKEFFLWMIDLFGPYPYGDELRFVFAPTYWNGFEHPGNIVLNDALSAVGPFTGSPYENPLAHTTNHEIAHLWAGNQTTLKSTYDFVWKEAMVEYLTFIFDDETGRERSAIKTNRAWELFSANAEHWLSPTDNPRLFDFYGDVYGPGPMILFRQIETLSSRSKVIQALQSLLGQPRALSLTDVQKALELSTGLPLEEYFDFWVRGQGKPLRPFFEVDIELDNAASSLELSSQNQRNIPFAKFHLEIVGIDPEAQTVHLPITWNKPLNQSMTIEPKISFPITEVNIDPFREYLNDTFPSEQKPSPWSIAR